MSTKKRPPKTLAQAHQERDQAMAQVEEASSPDWVTEATRATRDLAALTQGQGAAPFTPDDVWDLLETRGVEPPREPRALGPILKRLTKAAAIRPVGFTESRRRHGAPVRMYEASTGL